MKSYIDVTGKYLRAQKKRSVLTVVGIVLSVALVTGVGNIFTSLYDANIRSTIKNNGGYYASIQGVTADKAEALIGNIQTEQAGIVRGTAFAAYAGNQGDDEAPPYKYLMIRPMDSTAMTLLPYTLQEGRMPSAPGEIALDYWTQKYLPEAKIGGTVTLDIGTRTLPDGSAATDEQFDPKEQFTKTETQKYKVVGLLKPGYIVSTNFANAVAYEDLAGMTKDDTCSVLLKLKSKADIQNRVKEMVADAGLTATKSGPVKIEFNDHLLRLYAQSVNSMMNDNVILILLVIVGLVILSTIAVIYNAFNISVVERITQFGLLRCIGATPRQIRRIVLREATILGVIGIPLGVLCGVGAMGIVFQVISSIAANMILGGLRLVVEPWLIVASVVIGAATVYLSAFLPARKAAKVSPMEAVRSSGMYKKEKFRKSDRRRWVLALLGPEGWMAWKNLGRNRKRFYITVFSMVISIVLFIVFSSLMEFAYRSDAVDTSDIPSFVLTPANSKSHVELSDSENTKVHTMKGVDYTLAYSDCAAQVTLSADKLEPRAAELLKEQINGGTDATLLNSTLVSYPQSSLAQVKKLLKLSGLDEATFNAGKGVIVVNAGRLTDSRKKVSVLTNMTRLSAGDSLNVKTVEYEGESTIEHDQKVSVLAVVEEGIPGFSRSEGDGIILIAPESLFQKLQPSMPLPMNLMVMMKPGADVAEMRSELNQYADLNPGVNLMDFDEAASNNKRMMTVMSIFLYGFVTVISIIGCLNIINTISTNIIIRTRELSVLRAIGMSDGSVRRMVSWESILHGAAAALIGSVAGTALSWFLFSRITMVREFPWQFPWLQILIAVTAAAAVAVISGSVPLKRINRGVIVEGIRGEE